MSNVDMLNLFIVVFVIFWLKNTYSAARRASKQKAMKQKALQREQKPSVLPSRKAKPTEQATRVREAEQELELNPAFLQQKDYSEFDTPTYLRKRKSGDQAPAAKPQQEPTKAKSEPARGKEKGNVPAYVSKTRKRRNSGSFEEID